MAIFLQNTNFTDPQGINHTAATLCVSYANRYTNEDARVNINMSDMDTMTEVINMNKNITVQYYYWPDETKRLAGNAPYILANLNDGVSPPTMSFSFSAADAAYEGLSLEEQGLHYLQNVLLV